MNTVNLTGRITHDLNIKVTPTNKQVLDFQIAVRETKDESIFVRCQAWEQNADYLSSYAAKGSMVAITGSLKVDKYQNKEGNNVEKVYVRVSRAEIMDRRKEESNREEFNPNMGGKDLGIDPEELPFY